jgi:CheY-like chemotaxis protein
MKVEVRCPGCDKGYLVDEQSSLDEFSCPACFASIPLPSHPTVARPSTAAAQTARPAVHRPASRAACGTAAVVEASPAILHGDSPLAAEAVPAEVVCPRCNLHFSPRSTAPRTVEGARPVVLIVEDMAYFQEIASDALSEHVELRRAGTLSEARAQLAAGDVDLLVLDLTLDGGDHGIDLLREFPSKPCPILIFTAQDESEMYGDSWEELRTLGADDMVLKGMNVGESLVRKVGELLGKSWDDEDLAPA